MRRQTPLAHQLYSYLYPHPTSNDPPTFSAHLAKNLVPEVRIEVATFYGDLNSTEARYPGLNYCHPPHRMRLGRFKHHKRLFDAFDDLGLTYHEIQEFCCWEGTKWARERYEKDEGTRVLDTTGDEIGPYVDRRELREWDEEGRRSITRKTEISVIVEEPEGRRRHAAAMEEEEEEEDEDEDMSDDMGSEAGDDADESNGENGHQTPTLREHQFAFSSSSRNFSITQSVFAAWQQGRSVPPDIEQYLKEASERGVLGDLQRTLTSPRSSVSYIPRTAATASATSNAVAPRAAA